MRTHLPLLLAVLVVIATQVICTAWIVSALHDVGSEAGSIESFLERWRDRHE